MKLKKYKEKYSKKASKKPIKNKRLVDYKWIITVTTLAFLISLVFSFVFSNTTLPVAISLHKFSQAVISYTKSEGRQIEVSLQITFASSTLATSLPNILL